MEKSQASVEVKILDKPLATIKNENIRFAHHEYIQVLSNMLTNASNNILKYQDALEALVSNI